MGMAGVRNMLVDKMTLVDNRYLLQEQIGPEGPVELYFALDRQLQRPVVIEMLSERAATDEALCDKFHRHQGRASAIHHPNVLEIYDAGEWGGRPYLVMERDTGEPSPGDGATNKTPDPAIAMKVTRQAAEALSYCRQQGLAEWPFSYKAVRIGRTGNAHLALLEDNLLAEMGGSYVSRRDRDDPAALLILLRSMLSGTPDRTDMQPYISSLPVSVAELLRRMQPGSADSFTDAGEVAEAIRTIEAASNEYTQANFAVAPAQESIVATPPDLQRTSNLAEAPTLAVGQQAVVLPVPYTPAIEDDAADSNIDPPTPTSLPISSEARSYAPRRRISPLVLLSLLAGLILIPGILFLAGQRGTQSPLISDNLAALPTATASPALVAAPELRGKSLEDATSNAQPLGLQLAVGEPIYSDDVPSDKIVTQDPAPGTPLPAGAAITVALSLGPVPKEDNVEEGAAPPPVEHQPDQKQPPGKKDKGKKK
jgi:eukaryotic-like serine/threonine-protein kinase